MFKPFFKISFSNAVIFLEFPNFVWKYNNLLCPKQFYTRYLTVFWTEEKYHLYWGCIFLSFITLRFAVDNQHIASFQLLAIPFLSFRITTLKQCKQWKQMSFVNYQIVQFFKLCGLFKKFFFSNLISGFRFGIACWWNMTS